MRNSTSGEQKRCRTVMFLLSHHTSFTSNLLHEFLKCSVGPVNADSLHWFYGMVCFGQIRPGLSQVGCYSSLCLIHMRNVNEDHPLSHRSGLHIGNQNTGQWRLVFAGPQAVLDSTLLLSRSPGSQPGMSEPKRQMDSK